MTTPISGANAYATIARLTNTGGGATPSPVKATPDFSEMLKSAATQLVETGREADKGALDLAQGKADVVDVVTAIAETEVALETMVTLRDRVITAYQEILRMPI